MSTLFSPFGLSEGSGLGVSTNSETGVRAPRGARPIEVPVLLRMGGMLRREVPVSLRVVGGMLRREVPVSLWCGGEACCVERCLSPCVCEGCMLRREMPSLPKVGVPWVIPVGGRGVPCGIPVV